MHTSERVCEIFYFILVLRPCMEIHALELHLLFLEVILISEIIL